jgi:hypothetical protein
MIPVGTNPINPMPVYKGTLLVETVDRRASSASISLTPPFKAEFVTHSMSWASAQKL